MFPVSRCSSKIYFQTLNIIEEKLENDPILDLNRKDSDLLTGLFSWFSHSWTRRSLYRFFNENNAFSHPLHRFHGIIIRRFVDDPFYNLLKLSFGRHWLSQFGLHNIEQHIHCIGKDCQHSKSFQILPFLRNFSHQNRGFDFLLFKVWIQSLEGYGYPGAGFWIRFA